MACCEETERLSSAALGPLPENLPSVECRGPLSIVASLQSMAHFT